MNTDAKTLKSELQTRMIQFMNDYKKKNGLQTNWKAPLLGFADATGAYWETLKELISPTHYMPQDFLPDCTVVLSYFLPFVGNRNQQHRWRGAFRNMGNCLQ